LPMSTVQYNLDALKASGLIKASAFKYSNKGRKIQYYEPARKAIVIAPEESKKNIIELLGDKVIIPVIALISIIFGFFSRSFTQTSAAKTEIALYAGAPAVMDITTESAQTVIQPSLFQQYLPIIIAVVVFIILISIYVKMRKAKTRAFSA